MKLKRICQKIFSRSGKTDLKYEEAMEIYKRAKAILIDVRTTEEYAEKHLQGAINIPIYEVENIETRIPDKDTVILLYCQTGKRSKIVKSILLQNGYKNVYTFDAKL